MSHFDGAILKWGMTPKCRHGAGSVPIGARARRVPTRSRWRRPPRLSSGLGSRSWCVPRRFWAASECGPMGAKCHPTAVIRNFSELVAPSTMWEIESNSVGNGSGRLLVAPG